MWPSQIPQAQQATTGRWGAQASGVPLPCNSPEGLRVTPLPTIAVAIASVAAQAPRSVLPMQTVCLRQCLKWRQLRVHAYWVAHTSAKLPLSQATSAERGSSRMKGCPCCMCPLS